MTRQFGLGLIALVAIAGSATAAVDGQYQAAYGGPLAVQQNPTGFGNNTDPAIDTANGSELDGFWCFSSGGNLNLFFSGNLESNFNKFELFIDYTAGGQNQLRGDNAGVDFNGLNRMAGMTFDTGFSPDLWIGLTCGGGPFQMYANAAELLTGGGGNGQYLGQTGAGAPGALGGGTNFINIEAAINNSNIVGVDGGSAAGALTATSGIEIIIPLASLGLADASNILISAMINGGGHDFLANQVLGSLPAGTGNLGEPSTTNFNQFAGEQFIRLPSPGATALLGLAGLAAARRRRA